MKLWRHSPPPPPPMYYDREGNLVALIEVTKAAEALVTDLNQTLTEMAQLIEESINDSVIG